MDVQKGLTKKDSIKDSILNPLRHFHRDTEDFFKKQKKNATPLNAVALFLIISLLSSLLLSFADFGSSFQLISQASTSSLVGNLTSKLISFGLMFFFPLVLLLWAGGMVMLKSKAKFFEVLYMWMLPFTVFVLLLVVGLIVNNLFEPATPLLYLFFIPLFYFAAVSVKIVHNTTYGKAVFLIMFSNAAAGFVRIGMLMGYAILLFDPDPYDYVSNYTNESDGTLTATYSLLYKDSGEPKETCHVNLPEGWKPATKEMREVISKKIDRDIPTSDAAFYKNDDEFLFFVYGLPHGYGFNKCETDQNGEYWFETGFIPDVSTSETRYLEIAENSVKMCDSSISNKNNTDSRHIIRGEFLGTRLGFRLVHQSPAGEDQDLDHIIRNIRCYN
jgi:hypothetical protein